MKKLTFTLWILLCLAWSCQKAPQLNNDLPDPEPIPLDTAAEETLVVVDTLAIVTPVVISGDTVRYHQIGVNLTGEQTFDLVIDSANNELITFKLQPGTCSVSGSKVNYLEHTGSIFSTPSILLIGTTFGPNFGNYMSAGDLGNTVHWGKFEGAGDAYMGFRYSKNATSVYYGWVKLNLNAGCSNLTIIDYAINMDSKKPLWAGQKFTGEIYVPVPPIDVSTFTGPYSGNPNGSTQCYHVVTAIPNSYYHFAVSSLPGLGGASNDLKGRIVSGNKLSVDKSWSGNLPSPGGTDRPYSCTLRANGEVKIAENKIVWQVNYKRTGFSPDEFIGEMVMYKCQ